MCTLACSGRDYVSFNWCFSTPLFMAFLLKSEHWIKVPMNWYIKVYLEYLFTWKTINLILEAILVFGFSPQSRNNSAIESCSGIRPHFSPNLLPGRHWEYLEITDFANNRERKRKRHFPIILIHWVHFSPMGKNHFLTTNLFYSSAIKCL